MSRQNDGLPDGWTLVRIADVMDRLQYGYTAKASNTTSGPKFLRITDIQQSGIDWSSVPTCEISSDDFEKYRLYSGDIVFARTGSIEKAWRIEDPPEAIFASYLIRGRPIEIALGDWLAKFVQSNDYRKQITAIGAGIGRENVNARNLGQISFPLPPLAEQRRIVAKIDALQERSRQAREALSEVGPLLERFRQSVLAASFRGDLTADWRVAHPKVEPASELLLRIRAERRRRWERAEFAKYEAKDQKPPKNWKEKYKEPEPADNSGLPELPTSWIWATIDELTTFITSGSRGWAKYYSDAGPLFIRSQNLNTDRLTMNNIAHVTPPSGSEGERTRVARNDLLITITGANVTKVAMVDIDIDEAYVSQHIALARMVEPKLTKYLYLWMISSSNGRSQLLAAAYGNGKPGLNLDNIRRVAVALPPVTEQVTLLAMVEGMLHKADLLCHDVKAVENELDQLDQSILARAFRGELVPQDPSDEPASVFLERIRAQWEQQAEAAENTFKMRRRNKMEKKSSGLASQRRLLAEVLSAKGQPMSPERLLIEAGYEPGSIEDFYLALREEIKTGLWPF